MKKLFIVTSNPTTIDQDKVFQDWITPRFIWWHWLNQTWMLVDQAGIQKAAEIANEFQKGAPGIKCMVYELTSTGSNTWAGYGPTGKSTDGKDMFDWIRKYWNFS